MSAALLLGSDCGRADGPARTVLQLALSACNRIGTHQARAFIGRGGHTQEVWAGVVRPRLNFSVCKQAHSMSLAICIT